MKADLARTLPAAVKDQRRWITPEPLGVAPQWVGVPLATPVRRALAMGVDLGIVALLSGVSGLWLMGGLVAVAMQLRSQRGQATRRRQVVGWLVAGVLAMLAFQEAVSQWEHWRRPPEVRAAEKAAAAAEAAAEAAQDAQDDGIVQPGMSASAAAAALGDHQRIARLERELARARQPLSVKQQLSRFLDDIGAGLGWGIVYFSLLPAWWGGQTVGKKLLRMRVVELTGKPMTVLRSLKRYGGYAAGLATGGVGFAQILWDPNRQGLHDKAAHTAVIDLRDLPVAPAAAAAPVAPESPPAPGSDQAA